MILTRAPGRTPMPPAEDLARLAESRATMCIYLFDGEDRGAGGDPRGALWVDCPAAVVFHASVAG